MHEHEGQRTEEHRPRRLAELIENAVAIRENEAPRINLFVEHLYQGRLWGLGPDKAGTQPERYFVANIWQGQEKLPPIEDVRAWMKLVMPVLKKETGGDAMRLKVFAYLMAARKPVMGGHRLSDDKQGYIWNQVQNRIEKAWRVMAREKTKRSLKKSA